MTQETWRCYACQTFNETSRKRCQVCGEAVKEDAPAAAPPVPTWRCHACDTFNPGTVLSCELCDMARDATANIPRPAPKKPPPRPKASARTTAAAPTAPASPPRRPSPPRPPPEKVPAPPVEEEIFFAPTVFPSPPRTAAVPPFVPPPPPAAPPGGWSTPGYTAPPVRTSGSGCGRWVAILAGLFVLFLLGRGCLSLLTTVADVGDRTYEDTSTEGEPCPSRIADRISSSGRPVLVEAYETERHRIILCRDTGGQVYYHGEALESGEEGILMPAEATSDGYIARNETYSYEITGDTVIVANNGDELSRYALTPWDDPV